MNTLAKRIALLSTVACVAFVPCVASTARADEGLPAHPRELVYKERNYTPPSA